MYIRKIEIKNIRSIGHFEMTFPEGKEAGWHVLIGDNGSGKSTIVRSAALGLLGPDDVFASRENWNNWKNKESEKGQIKIWILKDLNYDSRIEDDHSEIQTSIEFNRMLFSLDRPTYYTTRISIDFPKIYESLTSRIDLRQGWFSVAYGPYRRFTGGNKEKEELFHSHPRLGAHLSIFGEDVALSEALSYIQKLYVQKLEKKPEGEVLEYLIRFINESRLLPHDAQIDSVDSENVFFRDGNGNRISAIQMSDGFRSVLSLTFELIRQLIHFYGANQVFEQIKQGNMIIDLPGVVLVDEIDAHLHPTWQTRIGQWFLQYFPNLQFIVTTHSPLVCRACEKGSIWRLAAPGSTQPSGEVTGLDRDRLIYGNVLDAYGTEVFGQEVERSEHSKEKLERLAHLSQLHAFGKISETEKKEMNQLRKILITDDTTEF
jgi:predicted ATP-binding protein involved in virulence